MTRVYYLFFLSVPEVTFRKSKSNNLYKYLSKGYKVKKCNNQRLFVIAKPILM